MKQPHPFTPKYVAGALLILGVALLYWLTIDNGLRPDELTGGDLITHQYAQLQGRPSNAPGYPLYTMGGWLWFRLAWPVLGWLLTPIELLSFYSALWGIASVAMLYLVLLHVLGPATPTQSKRPNLPGWPVALLLAAFYATTFFFWYYSVTTEQYTSAVFQTLLIIWLAFKWDTAPRHATLLALAFVSGTMLANMVTTLFILPPLLWFIFFRQDKQRLLLFEYLKRPKWVLQAVGLGLLPLLSYAYIYIRGAQHPEWRGAGNWSSNGEWFIQFLTIQQGRDELAPGLTLQPFFTAEFPALMWQELTPFVFIGGLVGLIFLGRRRAIFLYSTLAIYFVFCWGYRFGNWFQVIIPAYPIFIIGFAAGLRPLTSRSPRHRPVNWGASQFSKIWGAPINWLLILALAGLLIYRFSASLPQANQQNRPADTGLTPGWAIVADNPRPPAQIALDFEERVALEYLQAAWAVLPGITPLDVATIEQNPQASPPPYSSRRAWPLLAQTGPLLAYHPQAAGQQLVTLSGTPLNQLPPTAQAVQLDFGPHLTLAGWQESRPDYAHLPPGIRQGLPLANWQLRLYWQTSAPLEVDYTVSVRPLVNGQLITREGEPIIQDHPPVWGIYPTSRWQPDELVRDLYALHLPDGVTPETAQIVVYKTTQTGFENLGEQTIDFTPRADGRDTD